MTDPVKAPKPIVRVSPTSVVEVFDPTYRSRVLSRHESLSEPDAAELAAIYRALGYAGTNVTILSEGAAA
jgi:hypothetical protein